MIEQDKQPIRRKLGAHVRSTLGAGGLILVPIAITYVLIAWLFGHIDGLLQPAIQAASGRVLPGLGLLGLLIIVYLLGLLWTRRVGRRIVRTVQHYLSFIPVVGTVYGPVRQLIESFTGDSATGFNRVVVVEYPKQDTWMIGFLTGMAQLTTGNTIGIVYVPTAPTPNSGWVAMIPVQQIYDTSLSVQEAMSMVLSAGISSPIQIEMRLMDLRDAAEFFEQRADPTPQYSAESGVFELPLLSRWTDENK